VLTTIRQIRDLLAPGSRRRVWLLLGLMVVGTLLESLSIGVVVPVLGVLADPGWIARYPLLQSIVDWIGADSPEQLAIWAMAALVTVYTLKTAFAATLAYTETRFAYATQADISNRLYAGYMRQPWTFHLQRNSAELIRNATAEPQLFALYLLALLHLCAEGLVLVALTSLLIAVEPAGALVAVVAMGTAAALFQFITRRRVQSWGVRRQQLESGRLKQLQQGLGGAKEVKLLGREPYFERLFAQHNRGFAHTLQRQQFVSQLPRLWLEAVAVFGIALLVITLVMRDKSFSAALPTLGLFAAAAFRLLPSLNRIVGAVQTMRFRAPSLHVVHRELALVPGDGSIASTGERIVVKAIALDGVSYRYPAAVQDVLNNVTLAIDSGTTVGFIGPSGAGKSTLVDVILGLLPPSSGTVSVNGADIQRNLRAWQNSVGYVPQSIYLVDDTVRRNVAFGLPDAQIDDERVWRALRDASMEEFVRSLHQGLDTVTGERGVRLSGGQRQRIGIARALYHDPDVLVLDEATSALDGATEAEVMQAVGALHGRKTVLIIAHRLTTIANCDFVYSLAQGKAHMNSPSVSAGGAV
jgi:ABC-type multidrug transport system fused ATPase/permease subunit